MRVRLLTTCLLAVCSAVVACSDGPDAHEGTLAPGGRDPSASDAEAHPTRAICPRCAALEPIQLGGETSEFDGVDGRNPGTGTAATPPRRTAHDLADPALARWLQLVQGSRQLPLRWREGFRDAGLSGHAEQTVVSFDVTALRAFDESFEDSAETALYLDVAVRVSTADGALEATFEHTLRLGLESDGSERARSIENNPIVPLEQARGTLDLNLDPERDVNGALSLALEFAQAGARGQLSVFVQYPAEPVRKLITGSFPDDGCSLHESNIELGVRPGADACR